jgi:hypothetical protein
MTMYSTILFIHVIATLGLVVAVSEEAIALRQLVGASAKRDSGIPFERRPGSRIFSSICLLFLFVSGGYLTDQLSMWKLAWPKVAVAIVFLFGALAGISSRRLSKGRYAIQSSNSVSSRTRIRPVDTSFLTISVSLRIGLIVAAVFLMAIKPNIVASICVALGLPLICWLAVGMFGTKPQDSAAAKQSQASAN